MRLPTILLLSLVAGNVLLRFFTNELNILPRILNIWDVFITGSLFVLALLSPKHRCPGINRGRILLSLFIFNIICVAGSLLNSQHTFPMGVVSQLIMWNEPILLFTSILSLPFSLSDMLRFRSLLISLLVLETVIGVLQIPKFIATGASEEITGTFRGNAEQYQFFITLGLFWLLASREFNSSRTLIFNMSICILLAVIVLIDNKASWVSLAIALIILLPRLPTLNGNVRGHAKVLALLSFLLLFGYILISQVSATATGKFSNLSRAFTSGNILNLGKIKALRDILDAYIRFPHMAIVGSGLGTFYGRASFQYFPLSITDTMENASAASYSSSELDGPANDSASMAGIMVGGHGITPFYKEFFRYEKIFAVGSGTADFPTSSYFTLLGETGVLGTLIYLSFYRIAFRSAFACMTNLKADRLFLPLSVAATAGLLCLVLMAFYNFWLDSGRVNTITWAMLAITIRYSNACAADPFHQTSDV